jgi:protein gp37
MLRFLRLIVEVQGEPRPSSPNLGVYSVDTQKTRGAYRLTTAVTAVSSGCISIDAIKVGTRLRAVHSVDELADSQRVGGRTLGAIVEIFSNLLKS